MNLFQLLYSTVGRLEEFTVETFRAKPLSDFSRTAAGNRAYFHRGLFRYVGEFNKRGIGEIQ